MNNVSRCIATCFGLGFFPVGPGTFMSLVTVLAMYFLPVYSASIFVFTWLFLLLIGLISSHFAYNGSDASQIVIDELLGMSLAIFLVPRGWLYLVAFIVFRFLDIFKPFPIDKIQDISGGFGIILDDIFAGFITLALMHGLSLLYS